ncbi:hypothetical protein Lbir_2400 [Legionella birminghamensis]|uniref:Uncharacterized protein n=1 Tax=Legionella birminghamensis TaxID=28083 RepID=A0A378IFA9_9GAMM|nr:hypothetical protein Lbir_2400 [Legionella birminghamensis]STX33191.1 Uncharacterised protein [Legionella birminghamensis]
MTDRPNSRGCDPELYTKCYRIPAAATLSSTQMLSNPRGCDRGAHMMLIQGISLVPFHSLFLGQQCKLSEHFWPPDMGPAVAAAGMR